METTVKGEPPSEITNSQKRKMSFLLALFLIGSMLTIVSIGIVKGLQSYQHCHKKTDVIAPKYLGEREAIFIKDFADVALVDSTENRCFLLPPRESEEEKLFYKSVLDVAKKREAVVEIETPETRAVVGPVRHWSGIGKKITKECKGRTTYTLNSGVLMIYLKREKRDLESEPTAIRYFDKNGEFEDVVVSNFDEILKYEGKTA